MPPRQRRCWNDRDADIGGDEIEQRAELLHHGHVLENQAVGGGDAVDLPAQARTRRQRDELLVLEVFQRDRALVAQPVF